MKKSYKNAFILNYYALLAIFTETMLSLFFGELVHYQIRSDSGQLIKLLSNSLLGKKGDVLGYSYPQESGRQDLNLRPLRPERKSTLFS
jgi:hypothetical protein